MKPMFAAVVLAALLLPVATAQTPEAAALFNEGMNALSGTGLSRNPTRATDLLRRAADLGHAPAQLVLGYLYETGHALPANISEALAWYKKAAEQGEPTALWVVGRMYLTGSGPFKDLGEAEKWLLRSAEQGNPFGEYLLGLVREERDYRTAPEWFRKAAEQGLPQAQQKLGLALREGRGISLDKYQAYVWLLLSYESGAKGSAAYANDLEGQLSSAQLEHAKTEARDLSARYSRSVASKGCTGWHGEFHVLPSTPPPDIQRLCR